MNKINIFWFRRDLRLKDNVGLLHALKGNNPVLPIFIFDKNILSKITDPEDKRVTFIHETLADLKKQLRGHGSDCLNIYDSPKEAWQRLIETFNIEKVFTNEDYEPYAIKRDNNIATFLSSHKIEFHSYKDQVIFRPGEILKADKKPYTVFTPYKNKWLESLTPQKLSGVNTTKYFHNFYKIRPKALHKLSELGHTKAKNYQAPKKLIKKDIISHYDQTRDFPHIDGTSLLGVHLRFGTISPRLCAGIGYELNKTWLSELIWREFYMQILYHYDYVTQSAFKKKYEAIEWLNDKGQFKKWCAGLTGVPIVDAGMRQLNETGHMHNRVRMICASYLVKDLLIDWRWGEKYFAQKLLDYDLASNNGNWQWAAGCGCDAAPYFRIFNPYTQAKKFDKSSDYIKKWVPELKSDDYPLPLVDHKMAYHRALSIYKKALDKSK